MTKNYQRIFSAALLLVFILANVSAQDNQPIPCASSIALPENFPAAGEVRFAAVGDTGRGNDGQERLAGAMETVQVKTKFETLLFLGDNVYKKGDPEKFEDRLYSPYRTLRELVGVKTRGVLGNHDIDGEFLEGVKLQQKYFGMCGALAVCDRTFYQFALGEVDFFAIDSNLLVGHNPDFEYTKETRESQIEWLKKELARSKAAGRWQIVLMHHLFYSSSKGHGSFSGDEEDAKHKRLLQEIIPFLNESRTDVVLSGHDHLYEKIDASGVPAPNVKGDFAYFISGAGALTKNELRRTDFQICGEGRRTSFMLFSVKGDTLTYWAIDNTATPFDSGTILKN